MKIIPPISPENFIKLMKKDLSGKVTPGFIDVASEYCKIISKDELYDLYLNHLDYLEKIKNI